MLFATIHDVARMIDRQRAGREAVPSATILDSQTVKATAARAGRGYDGAKRTVGRKRHIAVDTDGRPPMPGLIPVDVFEGTGAKQIVRAPRAKWPCLRVLFADSAYDRAGLMDEAALLDLPSRSSGASRESRASMSCPADGWSSEPPRG
jgi:hypothetical protein